MCEKWNQIKADTLYMQNQQMELRVCEKVKYPKRNDKRFSHQMCVYIGKEWVIKNLPSYHVVFIIIFLFLS